MADVLLTLWVEWPQAGFGALPCLDGVRRPWSLGNVGPLALLQRKWRIGLWLSLLTDDPFGVCRPNTKPSLFSVCVQCTVS